MLTDSSFEPGVVLRCLQRGRWLVIDELNRADIDKAFGPLFTLLAGTGDDQPNRRVVLAYQRDGKNIEIRWAEKRAGAKGDYVLTPGWRMIGTLNISDKASLFQLSFAFLRRFAVVDVPLPPRDGYAEFFSDALGSAPSLAKLRDKIVDVAMDLAFASRELGPAILHDVAQFVRIGLSGDEYRDADLRRSRRNIHHGCASLRRTRNTKGAEASQKRTELMRIVQRGRGLTATSESWKALRRGSRDRGTQLSQSRRRPRRPAAARVPRRDPQSPFPRLPQPRGDRASRPGR